MTNSSRTTRYYLHGDEHEQNAASYYCAHCDLFEGKEHFANDNHVARRLELYEHSSKAWKELEKSKRTRYHRPRDARNLLADEAAADKRRRRAEPTAFFKWLVSQSHRDDPIGDLATDVENDPSFPITTTSREALNSYLRCHGACGEALVALDEALEEFDERQAPTRVGLSKAVRFEVFRADEYKCRICRKSADEGARLEVDHKTPVAKGGTNERSNLWTLCFDCNRGKRDSPL